VCIPAGPARGLNTLISERPFKLIIASFFNGAASDRAAASVVSGVIGHCGPSRSRSSKTERISCVGHKPPTLAGPPCQPQAGSDSELASGPGDAPSHWNGTGPRFPTTRINRVQGTVQGARGSPGPARQVRVTASGMIAGGVDEDGPSTAVTGAGPGAPGGVALFAGRWPAWPHRLNAVPGARAGPGPGPVAHSLWLVPLSAH
jgi:hypothetical protein